VSDNLPIVYLARHGENAWSLSGQHTGLTDLPLTERGQRNVRRLGERLKGLTFAKVLTSTLQRAACTCQLAGFGAVAETEIAISWNGTTAASWGGCARLAATCCCFPAGIFCACWRPAGSGWNRGRAIALS